MDNNQNNFTTFPSIVAIGLVILLVGFIFYSNSRFEKLESHAESQERFDAEIEKFNANTLQVFNKYKVELWNVRRDMASNFLIYNNISNDRVSELVGCLPIDATNIRAIDYSVIVSEFPNGVVYFYGNESIYCYDISYLPINCSILCNQTRVATTPLQ